MGLKNLVRRGLRRVVTELGIHLLEAAPAIATRTLPRFANKPQHLNIELPRRIINPDRMTLGDNVWIGPGSFLAAVTHYPSVSNRHPTKSHESVTYAPRIEIGDRVTSSGNLIIGAVQQVVIGDDVLLAYNVTILDNLHGFESALEPYKYQPLQRIAPVEVGRGCWIGQNVVILPSVKIGEMAIIGANSVVTGDIPERSIAVGAPARVIKQWDDKTGQWRPFNPPRGARANFR